MLAPHQLETSHLVNVVKLKIRRFVLQPGPYDAEGGLSQFLSLQQEWVAELLARKPDKFDLERYFRDRVEGWCEKCPHRKWRRKRGVRPRGTTLVMACEKCAARLNLDTPELRMPERRGQTNLVGGEISLDDVRRTLTEGMGNALDGLRMHPRRDVLFPID